MDYAFQPVTESHFTLFLQAAHVYIALGAAVAFAIK